MGITRALHAITLGKLQIRQISNGTAPCVRSTLAERAYGARFDFVSGMLGYCGDLYVISGDALPAPPMTLIRRDGHLLVVTDF